MLAAPQRIKGEKMNWKHAAGYVLAAFIGIVLVRKVSAVSNLVDKIPGMA